MDFYDSFPYRKAIYFKCTLYSKMDGGRVVRNAIRPLDQSASKIRIWYELALYLREGTSKIPKHNYRRALTQQELAPYINVSLQTNT